MGYIHQKQYSDEISKLRYDENINEAINKCREATTAFPESNFFYKILGDLYVQNSDYHNAAKAYLEQLKRLSTKPEQFKTFARFYKLIKTKMPSDFLDQYNSAIIDAIKKGEIAQNICKLLIENLGRTFITDNRLLGLFEKSNNDVNLTDIKQFVDLTRDDDEIRALILYRIDSVGDTYSSKIDQYLISVAEKKKCILKPYSLSERCCKNRKNVTQPLFVLS